MVKRVNIGLNLTVKYIVDISSWILRLGQDQEALMQLTIDNGGDGIAAMT